MPEPDSAESPFDLDLSTHSHDGFFKAVFSDPDKAGAFFQKHLPEAVVLRVDWSTLTVLPASFVKQTLQQSHSDLLFSVRISGRESLLYLVFEHQSSQDSLMPLRLLGYMVEILLTHTRDNAPPLPPVIGFVLHQGPAAWNVSTSFEDLFELPPSDASALLPFLPKFRHALLDLTQCEPARGEDRADVQMILQLMKCVREQRMLDFFDWLAAEYARLRTTLSDALLRMALWYAMHSEARLDVQAIYRHLQHEPQLQNATMTIAEKLITQGRREGEAQGRREGEAQGREEGRAQGREEGKIQGSAGAKLQMFQFFLGDPVISQAVLDSLTLQEIERCLVECQARYDLKFKRP